MSSTTTSISDGMPEVISSDFEAIHRDIVWLHIQWKLYRELFGVNAEHVAILNKAAPAFAYCIQGVMQDAVYLGITRLTDPPQQGPFSNLTLSRLEIALDGDEYINLKEQLKELLHEIDIACKKFRSHRNKRIAHADRSEAGKATFKRPSRDDIEKALDVLRRFMNTIYRHFRDGEIAYEHSSYVGGGGSLLYSLRESQRFVEIRKQVLCGKLTGEELRVAIISPNTGEIC